MTRGWAAVRDWDRHASVGVGGWRPAARRNPPGAWYRQTDNAWLRGAVSAAHSNAPTAAVQRGPRSGNGGAQLAPGLALTPPPPPPAQPLPAGGAIRCGARLCRRHTRALIQIPRVPAAPRSAAMGESAEVPTEVKKRHRGVTRKASQGVVMRQPRAGACGMAAGRRCRWQLRQGAGKKGADLHPHPTSLAKERRCTRAAHARACPLLSRARECPRRLCKAMARPCHAVEASRPSHQQNAAHGLCASACGRPHRWRRGKGTPTAVVNCSKTKTSDYAENSAQHRAAATWMGNKISLENETTPSVSDTGLRTYRWPPSLAEEATRVATGGAGGLPTRPQ